MSDVMRLPGYNSEIWVIHLLLIKEVLYMKMEVLGWICPTCTYLYVKCAGKSRIRWTIYRKTDNSVVR